ncbi:Protein of unknown function [Gryllus bimaculatus]|nr:Protein of unknown function [Gryllus bimaculatus]
MVKHRSLSSSSLRNPLMQRQLPRGERRPRVSCGAPRRPEMEGRTWQPCWRLTQRSRLFLLNEVCPTQRRQARLSRLLRRVVPPVVVTKRDGACVRPGWRARPRLQEGWPPQLPPR